MKQSAYFIIASFLIFGCGGKDNSAENIKNSDDNSVMNQAQSAPKEIVGIGKVEPENEIINLAAASGGVIIEIYKKDGEKVKQGEELLKLDDEIERIRIVQLKSQLKTQQTQIEYEKAASKEIEVNLANKNKTLVSVRNLLKKGAETGQNADDFETEVKTLEINLEKSEISVHLAQNKLTELNDQLKLYEAEANKKTLRSPFTGVILEMLVKKGSAINQFQNYADFAPEGSKIIKAEVDELFCKMLKEGQSVDIRYLGSSNNIASGKIIFLSPFLKKKSLFSEKANDQEDRRVREVKIAFNENSDLFLNSKVECIIKL